MDAARWICGRHAAMTLEGGRGLPRGSFANPRVRKRKNCCSKYYVKCEHLQTEWKVYFMFWHLTSILFENISWNIHIWLEFLYCFRFCFWKWIWETFFFNKTAGFRIDWTVKKRELMAVVKHFHWMLSDSHFLPLKNHQSFFGMVPKWHEGTIDDLGIGMRRSRTDLLWTKPGLT